jgi:hypothetical protein
MEARLTSRPTHEVIAAIQGLDLESVKTRLIDPELGKGWTREYAEQIEAAYRTFLTMLVKHQDHAEQIMLSKDTDEFWHTHILQTMKYAEDCDTVFGAFLHHNPHVGERTQADLEEREKMAQVTRALYEQEFGSEQGADVAWSGQRIEADSGAYSSAAIRGRNAAYSSAALRARAAAYSSASISRDGAAYSSAAITGKDAAYSSASIRGANAAYSSIAIAAGQAAYSSAAITAERAAYSSASIRADKAAYSSAAIKASDAAYSSAAIEGRNAAYSSAAIVVENAAYSSAAVRT